MTNDSLKPVNFFHDLKWQRLPITFLCKKNTTQMKSHPVSVFQAIIKAVSSKIPAFSSLKNDDLPVFHIKDKKHTFKMNPLDSIQVDFFFFKQKKEEITSWRQNLVEYLSK
ncbi:MAG TPA: hypothetical protein VK186_05700, partial [Candidatus Deferrimicrobium sp.]|nr:hypothetical protein [Candidatus Deferrimicrobium sp.]